MRSSRWLEKFGRIRWNMKMSHNPGWTPYQSSHFMFLKLRMVELFKGVVGFL